MCLVSMIGDDFNSRLPGIAPNYPYTDYDKISRAEFELFKAAHEEEVRKLKSEVESMKKLLKAAKIYDEETGQPDCEVDEKIAAFKKLAELLGVDMTDVFGDD